MKDPERIKKGLKHCTSKGCFECPYSDDGFSATIECKLEIDKDALEYIETLEERIAIMSEGGEIKYPPEQGELYDTVYWFCGNCNEPIEHGSVEQKHLPDYCRFCGGRIKKGEDDED